MEMLIGIMTGVIIAWFAGRAMKMGDEETVVLITFAGAGATAVGLLWQLVSGNILGTSASPMWIVTGAVGGVAAIVTYKILTFVLYDVIFRNREHDVHKH